MLSGASGEDLCEDSEYEIPRFLEKCFHFRVFLHESVDINIEVPDDADEDDKQYGNFQKP